MAFTKDKWIKRIKSRTDISAHVYHLTKAEVDGDGKKVLDALERLLKIVSERKINGSTTKSGFITGDRKAVCFQDAPITGIVQNVLHENDYREELGGKTRYTYLGIAFPKPYIFQNGGRPVLYEEKEVAKKFFRKKNGGELLIIIYPIKIKLLIGHMSVSGECQLMSFISICQKQYY